MDDLTYYLDGMSSRNRTAVRRQSAIEFCRRIRESDQAKFFQNISPQLGEVGNVLANLNAGDASLTRLAIISALNLSTPVSGVSYLPSSLVSFLLTNLDNARDSPPNTAAANTLSTPSHAPNAESAGSQSYSSRRRRQASTPSDPSIDASASDINAFIPISQFPSIIISNRLLAITALANGCANPTCAQTLLASSDLVELCSCMSELIDKLTAQSQQSRQCFQTMISFSDTSKSCILSSDWQLDFQILLTGIDIFEKISTVPAASSRLLECQPALLSKLFQLLVIFADVITERIEISMSVQTRLNSPVGHILLTTLRCLVNLTNQRDSLATEVEIISPLHRLVALAQFCSGFQPPFSRAVADAIQSSNASSPESMSSSQEVSARALSVFSVMCSFNETSTSSNSENQDSDSHTNIFDCLTLSLGLLINCIEFNIHLKSILSGVVVRPTASDRQEFMEFLLKLFLTATDASQAIPDSILTLISDALQSSSIAENLGFASALKKSRLSRDQVLNTFSKLQVSKMENRVVASYSAVLLACLARDESKISTKLISLLQAGDLTTLLEVLDEFIIMQHSSHLLNDSSLRSLVECSNSLRRLAHSLPSDHRAAVHDSDVLNRSISALVDQVPADFEPVSLVSSTTGTSSGVQIKSLSVSRRDQVDLFDPFSSHEHVQTASSKVAPQPHRALGFSEDLPSPPSAPQIEHCHSAQIIAPAQFVSKKRRKLQEISS